MTSFLEKLTNRIRTAETLLCVGIDPPLESAADLGCLSTSELEALLQCTYTRCSELIRVTAPYACCFKPNLAFFEQFGPKGLQVLQRLLNEVSHEIPVILDAKRSAFGDAAEAEAIGLFSTFEADCVTLDPYMGREGLEVFLKRRGKGAFVVCKSSNPRGDDIQAFQAQVEDSDTSQRAVYLQVAKICQDTKNHLEPQLTANGGVVGLVVGATYPQEIKTIRRSFPSLWILAPGVGAQGADLEAAVSADVGSSGLREDGSGFIVNVGRAIAEAEDPAKAAEDYTNRIRQIRERRMQQSTN